MLMIADFQIAYSRELHLAATFRSAIRKPPPICWRLLASHRVWAGL